MSIKRKRSNCRQHSVLPSAGSRMEKRMKQLSIAVVTGASSGMGREFVRLLDRELSTLDEIWVIARRGDRLRELSDTVKTTLVPIELDLSDPDAAAVLGSRLKEKKPRVKVLVNSAGFGKIGRIKDLPVSDQLSMLRVNCLALTEITCLMLPFMTGKSRIINLASAAAFLPQPGFSVYAASKAYVLSFSRALNRELAGTGTVVTAVCPGPVKTEFFELAEQTGVVPLYKRLVMADPVKVVEKAFRDSVCGKPVSVYGIPMKGFQLITKLLPHEKFLQLF